MSRPRPQNGTVSAEELFPVDHEMVELALLLRPEHAAALEEEARQRQLTVGQLTRRLIKDFLYRSPPLQAEHDG